MLPHHLTPTPLEFLRRPVDVFTSVYVAVQKLKNKTKSKSSSLAWLDNTKLNGVDILSEAEQGFKLLDGLQGEKRYALIGIEPQFKKILLDGPYVPNVISVRKPEAQWSDKERKAANLDQRLKSLIVSVPPDVQMNFVINCEDVTQTFTSYKALMNELVKDGIIISKLGINNGFINHLPKKWLSFSQSLRNANHVRDCDLASLFGKLKYEENLIDSIYEGDKKKSLTTTIPLSTSFFSNSIVQCHTPPRRKHEA
ncbi:hypothetical protein Tco_0891194 [Tanacetum coccineum]|uniref:Uncharacterized protein n=1 Tax=Tanacetum coccineum TaxID=301880 RepID=A0ABQ5C566_9ASTR